VLNIDKNEKKYHTVGTKSNTSIKILERGKYQFPQTKTCPHFPCLIQTLQ